MGKLELFEIIKRELIWKDQTGEQYEYNSLGVVKSVGEATEIVNFLNRKAKNEQITYFYKDLEFDLYHNAKNFLKGNSRELL